MVSCVSRLQNFSMQSADAALLFLLCENSPGAVIGYLGCLNAGAVPLLLNAQMDTGLLQEMYEHYRPEYVWMPEECQWKPYALWDDGKNGTVRIRSCI